MAQVVEYLFSKHEALSSNPIKPSPPKKEKEIVYIRKIRLAHMEGNGVR
jgi:hypothetical protein